jgi:putative N-acetylmannosamine-6-phosphate epimerase
MAEGRFDTPDLASFAIAAGADAVTVGRSLTMTRGRDGTLRNSDAT